MWAIISNLILPDWFLDHLTLKKKVHNAIMPSVHKTMNGRGHSSAITLCAARASLWSKITLLAQKGKQPEMLLFCKYTAYRVSHCITEYHWQSQSKDWPRQKESWTRQLWRHQDRRSLKRQLWRHHIVHRRCSCHVWALQAIINVPAEDWKVLGEAVSVLCQQGSLDPLHKIFKPAKLF